MHQRWHLVTGEYPPQPGGVADYSRSIAQALAAAGDEVLVWAPSRSGPQPADEGVSLRRLPGYFGLAALSELDAALCRLPGRVLLQYTPHAFGWKAMNVPLCAWLWARRRRLDVMFHEVAFPFVPGQPWKHQLLAAVQRGMAMLLLKAAERVFVSIPGWEVLLNRLASSYPRPVWAPVPSNLATACEPDEVTALRGRLQPGSAGPLVGHFGTYGPLITELLAPALPELLRVRPDLRVLLLGRGGPAFAAGLTREDPDFAGRVLAPGELDAQAAADHVACCDVMLQPYPDGISSRRGSAMAALALGAAMITTEGELSEPVWRSSAAVVVATAGNLARAVLELLADPQRRDELGRRAADLYRSHFAVEHTVHALRQGVCPTALAVQGLP